MESSNKSKESAARSSLKEEASVIVSSSTPNFSVSLFIF